MSAEDDAKLRMLQYGASYMPSINTQAQTSGQGTGSAWMTGMPDWVRGAYQNQGVDTSSVHNWTPDDYALNSALIADPSKGALLKYGASFMPSVNPTAQSTGAGIGTPWASGVPDFLSWIKDGSSGGSSVGSSGGGSAGGGGYPASGGGYPSGGSVGGAAAGGGGFGGFGGGGMGGMGGFDLNGLMSMFGGGGMGGLFGGGAAGGGGSGGSGGGGTGGTGGGGSGGGGSGTPAPVEKPKPIYAGAYTPEQLEAQNAAADNIYRDILKGRQDASNAEQMRLINEREAARQAKENGTEDDDTVAPGEIAGSGSTGSSGTGGTGSTSGSGTGSGAGATGGTSGGSSSGSTGGTSGSGGHPSSSWGDWYGDNAGHGGLLGGLWDAFQNVANQFNQRKGHSAAQPTAATGSGAPAAPTGSGSGAGAAVDDDEATSGSGSNTGNTNVGDRHKRRSMGLGMGLWGGF